MLTGLTVTAHNYYRIPNTVPSTRNGAPHAGVDDGVVGPVEIQLSLRLGVSQAITNRLHYSHSDFNKTTKQKIGPPADTVIVTSSEITAREPQQNPVLVFSITLTQKRVRPPVWIILVLYAELASVKTLLVKGLYHSNLPSTLELVCDVPSLLHANTQSPRDP